MDRRLRSRRPHKVLEAEDLEEDRNGFSIRILEDKGNLKLIHFSVLYSVLYNS